MAYALSLSGLLTTCRHHFVQRPHAQFNSIVSFLQRGRVTSRLGGNALKQCTCACVMAERRCSAHADVEQSDGGTLSARKPRDPDRLHEPPSDPSKRGGNADTVDR